MSELVERSADHMLSTVDNPYNPFTEFDDWYGYDAYMQYHCLAFLARVLVTSEEMSDADQSLAVEVAIDEIVNEDPLDLYRKVKSPDSVIRT